MSQNIEIEFKNLLTEEEFTQLQNVLNIPSSLFTKQINYYFDTQAFFLKENGCALRIRLKNGKYELTLKEPHPDGLLETNQQIPNSEAIKMLEDNRIIPGPVREKLEMLGLPMNELQLFGALTTERAEKEYEEGLLVLDYSSYLNQTDYEVEYEVNDFERGKDIFTKFLSQLHIPIRPTKNKVRRLYEAMLNIDKQGT